MALQSCVLEQVSVVEDENEDGFDWLLVVVTKVLSTRVEFKLLVVLVADVSME